LSNRVLRPDTAAAFEPLWTKRARYLGAWGGRGSGKSNDRAQAVVIGMLATPGFRVVCLREVQKSIRDSVYQLLADWIDRLGVGAHFEVLRDEIRGRNGSYCIFRGMTDQNAESIKSLEGFDVAWFEEAQAMSARSLQLLRPTIRKERSQLWFTWNPRRRTDPVDLFLRAAPPEGAVVVKANYGDNPWFPDVLDAERRIDEAGDEANYRHVWLGDYEAVSDRQLIPQGIVTAAMGRDVGFPEPFDELVVGVDVARFGGDETVIAFRHGRSAARTAWMTFQGLDTMETAARVAAVMEMHRPDAVFIDETGVGAGVVDRLRQLGLDIVPVNFASKPQGLTTAKVANRRAEMWVRMRDWLAQGGVAIPNDPRLESELTAVEYKPDVNNAILLEKKDDMRKRGLSSPDRADALALTFALPVRKRGDDDAPEEWADHARNDTTGY